MLPMTGVDGSFLNLETPQTPMHVGSLHLFEVPDGDVAGFHPMLVRHIAARLDRVPVFRRRLAPMPLQFANPVWVDDDGVDLDHHIRRVVLPAPGTREQLFRAAADLHSTLMDRSRPLWMIYVFEGLASGEVAYYIKVHHAVLDGQAGIALAQTLFDDAPHAPVRRRPRASGTPRVERPGTAALAAAAFRHDAAQLVRLVRQLPEVARTLGGLLRAAGAELPSGAPKSGRLAPRTVFNASVGTEREFAAVSIPLAQVKRIAAAHEAKVNDVVLAICSTALRGYLKAHGGIPRRSLVASMPVSLRAPGQAADYTTQVTMALVSLASDVADPVRRLRAIRDAAGSVKSTIGRARNIIPTDFPTIGLPWITHGLATLAGRSHLADALPPLSNVVISNVPGPRGSLYGGLARMTSYWPLSIVEHGAALNITLISYAGELGFGLIAARNAVPDLAPIAQGLLDAFEELERRTPSAEPVEPRRSAASRRSSKNEPKPSARAPDKVQYGVAPAPKAAAARGRASARRPVPATR